jgi:hypothetical protein
MSIVAFPTRGRAALPRPPRLLADEERVKQWYYNLEWEEQDRWITLHEIKHATGVPLTRLPTVLHRLGWVASRKRGFPLTMFHGPFMSLPLREP